MANKKYKLANNDYWESSGVYDLAEGKTQREVNAALKGSLNAITPFDSTPTSGSTKGVTSGGVYTALETVEIPAAIEGVSTDSTSPTQATLTIYVMRWKHLCQLTFYVSIYDGFNTGSANRIIVTLPQTIPAPLRTVNTTDINLVSANYYSNRILRIQNNGTPFPTGARAFDFSILFYTN